MITRSMPISGAINLTYWSKPTFASARPAINMALTGTISLNQPAAAVQYKFHPDFAGKVNMWWGDPTKDWGLATLEGGDVMPIGKGDVLIGMSERTSRQAISQLAAALFEKGGAERVIIGAMPKLRVAMHIDTVFTFADRDCVLIYPDIVNKIECFSYRPGAKKGTVELHKEKGGLVETIRGALGLKTMRLVETGGTDYMRERTQWKRRQSGLRLAGRGLRL